MAKKKTLKQASEEKKSPQLAENLMGSANEIWLAGLGAFSKAQTEGKKIFDKLIEQGKDFEQAFKSQSQKAGKDIKSSVSGTVDSAKKKASESWDKLESVFETRVEKSLHRLGVPTNDELHKLVDRIEKLTAQVSELTAEKSGVDDKKSGAQTTKKVAKKTSKKKTTKKKAVTKKSASKKEDGASKSTSAKSKATKKATTKKTAKKKASKK
ncbi:phasin family protein [Marinicella gelatinilytica]|uniref:phasin family protein n=1 Tax=Marinicella gelatinilytica TaxID=2996017 RepID=UPI00226101AB|nr:phasin family protein [Marinicella gelatinilytica]MCX7544293.1 phasin family protein [Marinicella gelatinilytica]